MIPKRVVLENFLSFASPSVAFDFTGGDEALWVITGPNGCGKSAVFDGITYALFECHRGSATKQKQELLMRHGADHCRVILEFDFAGHGYRITRGRSRAGKTTKPVQKLEERTAGGEWRSLDDGNSGAALNKWVIDTLGLDYDAFTTSVLLRQGAADKLLSASKEDRLQILKGIIGFEQYEALSERVRLATQGVRAGAAGLRSRFNTLVVVTPEELTEYRTRTDETEVLQAAASVRHAEAIARIERSKTWQKCHARLGELETLLEQAGRRADRAEAIRAQKARADELGSVLPVLQSLFDGRRKSAELQDSLDDRESLRKDAALRRDAADTAGTEARGRLAEHMAASERLGRELEGIERAIARAKGFHKQALELDKFAGDVSRYPVDLPERLARSTEAEEAADEKSRLTENGHTEARTHLKAALDEQAEFRDVEAGVKCSRCGQPVSADHARIERERMADGVTEWQTRVTERQAAVGESRGILVRAKADRAALAKQSAERDRSADKYDALCANLTGQGCASKAAELVAEIASLDADRAASRRQWDEAEGSRCGADAAAVVQDALIGRAEAELAVLGPQIARAESEWAALSGKQAGDAARLNPPWVERWPTHTAEDMQALEMEHATLGGPANYEEYRQLLVDDAQRGFWKDERDRLRCEIDGIAQEDRVTTAVAEGDRILAARQQAEADADHRATLRHYEDSKTRADEYRRVSDELSVAESHLGRHETLGNLLGEKGLQLDLVRGAETEVIALADDTLRRLSNQDLSLEADEDATGQNVKAFALRIRKAGEAQPTGVDFISGSQRFRVAVSLALAIGRFAAGKQRPIEAVIIDEGFGSLDKDGLRAMAENLHELRRTQALKKIILVSHQESFTDHFNTGYLLTPGEGGTTATRLS